MGSRSSTLNGGTPKCAEDTEALQEHDAESLEAADEARLDKSLLDLVRLAASRPETRTRLFVRATPQEEELRLLSEAGVLRTRGRKITNCRVDTETGERLCVSTVKEPELDCRVPQCPYAAIMRTRLVTRLRAAYALERKKLGVG